MPDFVRTSLTRQYVNSLHSKEEFLDIEDDSDNIDEFIQETPYDKLCSPSTTISDSELLRAIKVEGTETFLQKANHLIEKNASRFRSSLTSEAARLKAFDLELQPESNWFTNRQNKLPTRLQSLNKLAQNTFNVRHWIQNIYIYLTSTYRYHSIYISYCLLLL